MIRTNDIEKLVEEFGSVGNILVNSMFLEKKLKALEFLYEHGKDLVYENGEFIEKEFPLNNFKKYVRTFYRVFKDSINLIKVNNIYANFIYIFAIAYKHGINLGKAGDDYVCFVNEYIAEYLKSNLNNIRNDVIEDFYNYIYFHKFKFVKYNDLFLKGIYKYLEFGLVDKEKFKENIIRFIKKYFVVKKDDICLIYKIRKKIGEDIILSIIEKAKKDEEIILASGLFINEKYLNKKIKFIISEKYIEYLKSNGIKLSINCGKTKINIENRLIEYICQNVPDFWVELKSAIEETEYCNEKMKCCNEINMMDIFEI